MDVLTFWPHFLLPLSWPWRNPNSYNFLSSEAGGLVVKLLFVAGLYLVWRPWSKRVHAHLECHVTECPHWGHPVAGTGYRACHDHHPAIAHKPGGVVTKEHIQEAHRLAQSDRVD